MRFGILGPLEVWDGATPVPLGGALARGLLAALVVRADRVVPIDDLVDALWPTDPPRTARQQVYSTVSALRRALGADVLVTSPPGYRLCIAPEQLDSAAFETQVVEARAALAEGDARRAADGFRAALELWRGPVLHPVTAPFAVAEANRLGEQRLAALEDRIEADLRLGRHDELISELLALTAEVPLRERPRGQLMLALHRAGRRGEALDVYRAYEDTLGAELGIDTGPALRRLQQAILTTDPGLDGPDGSPVARPAVPPAQLPPDVPTLTGRDKAVSRLCPQLAGTGTPATAVPLAIITGPGGVGKTALAVRVAHLVRDRFPDGQLYVDLRGTDDVPFEVAGVLMRLLTALDVAAAVVPDETEARVALYRTRLAERRVLVVLDNAASAAQVRPLLPAGPGCAVLVTSRTRLTGLDGALWTELEVLGAADALDLLAALIGADRTAAEPTETERIATLCGNLPLALRIAAAKLAARPHWSCRQLADRLADEYHRLDELQVDDLRIRASLATGAAGLGADTWRALRLLALLDTPDFPAWTAAAMIGAASTRSGEDLVELLVERYLLEYAGTDRAGQPRYRFHDLTRLWARERALAEDSEPVRAAAVEAALRGWRARAVEALHRLPYRLLPAFAPRPDGADGPAVVADPTAWYEAERAALVAAVRQAHDAGRTELCVDLALAVAPYADLRSHRDDAQQVMRLALAAARRAGDRSALALVQLHLGRLEEDHDHRTAERHYRAALATFEERADPGPVAGALAGLGYLHGYRNEWPDAQRVLDRALRLSREAADRHTEAVVLRYLAGIARTRGATDESELRYREALELFVALGDRRTQAATLYGWARLAAQQGDVDTARLRSEQALAICVDLHDRIGETHGRLAIADLLLDRAEPGPARAHLLRALALSHDTSDTFGSGRVLASLGRAARLDGDLPGAAGWLARSVEVWRTLGIPLRTAQLLVELGDVRLAERDRSGAVAAWREAATLMTGASDAERGDVETRLRAADAVT